MNNEDITTEYKREFSNNIKKTLCALVNTKGGKIYIGIDDDAKTVGVENPDFVMQQIINLSQDSIKPDISLFMNCETQFIEKKAVVVITVQPGCARPYYITGKGIRPEGVFVRKGSSTIPASETAILRMIKESSHDSFEEKRSLLQELNLEDFYTEFSNINIPIQNSHLKTLGLLGDDNLYTNLALLLSSSCEHSIKVAFFQGNSKEIFKDRHEFTGSLLRQARECYRVINQYNSTRSEFSGLHRIDFRDYPESALRESLLNAIVHRDYSYNSSILISIFDNRIEFVTVGGLVKGISLEDMMLGVSILRNKKLGEIFYRLKLIEAFGTGIPKIMESYANEEQKPKIEATDNAFKITLYKITKKETKQASDKRKNFYYTKGENSVLQILEDNPIIERQDIENKLNVSQPMAIKYLKSLLEKEAIEKHGNGKNTHYSLKN